MLKRKKPEDREAESGMGSAADRHDAGAGRGEVNSGSAQSSGGPGIPGGPDAADVPGGPAGGGSPAAGEPDLERKILQLTDQLQRRAAEFENYKKRTENEAGAMIRFANEALLQKLIPILDDVDRWVKSHQEASPDPGLDLIFTKLRKTLEQIGLTPFDSTGKPFDPELHDAMLQVPRPDLPHHTVVEEVDRGYKYHDRILRHARVIVSARFAQPPDNDQPETADPDDIGGEA